MVNFRATKALRRAERSQLDRLGIYHQFPLLVKRQAHHLTIPAAAFKNRVTVEGQVSLDPPKAHELDDLIKVVREGDAFRVFVSIADPSFIPIGSPIDKEAAKRASSLYFPGTGYLPMLPPQVTQLASLVEGKERLTVTLEMLLSAQGQELEPPKLYRSVSINAAALDYEAADAIRQNPDHDLSATISASLEVSKVLLDHGPRSWLRLDLDKGVSIDETGKVTKLEPHEQFPTYQVVPPLMVLANSTIADLLQVSGHPTLFRCHEPQRGLLEHNQFVAAMDQLRQTNGLPVYYTQLVGRERAGYLPQNLSGFAHQGLGLGAYVHFTSPLRRYADIVAHRAVQQILDTSLPTPNKELADLARHCSTYPAKAQIFYSALLGQRRAERETPDLENLLAMPENEFSDLLAGVLTFSSDKVNLVLSAVRQRALRPIDLAQLIRASAHNLRVYDLVLDFLKNSQDFSFEQVLTHLNILEEWDGCTFLSPDDLGRKEPPKTKNKSRGKGRKPGKQAPLFARRVMNSIAGRLLASPSLAIDHNLDAVETEAARIFLTDLVKKKLVAPDQVDNKAWINPHQAKRKRAPFVNFIGNLIKLAQRQSWAEPEYVVESVGTEAAPLYEARVIQQTSVHHFTGFGTFRTEQGAKQNASRDALLKIERSKKAKVAVATEDGRPKRSLIKCFSGFVKDNPDFTNHGFFTVKENPDGTFSATAFVDLAANGERLPAPGTGQSKTEARANAAENLWSLLAERGLTSY